MTSFPSLIQPFLDIANSLIYIIYCFVPFCIGAFAAWNSRTSLFALFLVGIFASVFSKFANFAPNIYHLFNSAFIFLISGFLISIGIKLAFNHWKGY
ncbi:hypothetical protein [Anabaena sp. UHCC 0204]|uniref:hypothetical protein n=1 Tax=Anabaena sp. UHCC 0204 TaxID=2590009 RepID=UPI001447B284|nr:hypothetical protein [Anabaena sp. UHCC 0204]MTJ10729.1 hypothetical protein [Anabaena sp. UHCC 0204]